MIPCDQSLALDLSVSGTRQSEFALPSAPLGSHASSAHFHNRMSELTALLSITSELLRNSAKIPSLVFNKL